VLITGRDVDRLAQAAAGHPNIEVVVADVSRPEDASRTISKAIKRWGRLDVLVNNAGAGAIMPLAEVSAELISISLQPMSSDRRFLPRRRYLISRKRRDRSSIYRAPTVQKRAPPFPTMERAKLLLNT
jgi:hypothetical protein